MSAWTDQPSFKKGWWWCNYFETLRLKNCPKKKKVCNKKILKFYWNCFSLWQSQYVNTMKDEAISLREDNILRQCFVIQINTHKERRLCVQAWFQQKGPETVFGWSQYHCLKCFPQRCNSLWSSLVNKTPLIFSSC